MLRDDQVGWRRLLERLAVGKFVPAVAHDLSGVFPAVQVVVQEYRRVTMSDNRHVRHFLVLQGVGLKTRHGGQAVLVRVSFHRRAGSGGRHP